MSISASTRPVRYANRRFVDRYYDLRLEMHDEIFHLKTFETFLKIHEISEICQGPFFTYFIKLLIAVRSAFSELVNIVLMLSALQ